MSPDMVMFSFSVFSHCIAYVKKQLLTQCVWLLYLGQVVISGIKWLCESHLDSRWSATTGNC